METENIIQQLKDSFYLATGKDLTEWEKAGIPYMVIPDIIFFYYLHYCNDKEEFYKTLLESIKYSGIKCHKLKEILPEHLNATFDFIKLFEEKKLYDNQAFISAAVTLYLPFFKNVVLQRNKKYPRLPECKKKNEIFVDLITGFEFFKYYPSLKEDTIYYLVDISLFACEGLEQEKKLYPNLDIRTVRKNILELNEEDFAAPISVLRVKNLSGYVRNITKHNINRLQNLIRSEGQFIFQEYAYLNRRYCSKREYWFRGWKKTVRKGNPEDKNDLDTITYMKPK